MHPLEADKAEKEPEGRENGKPSNHTGLLQVGSLPLLCAPILVLHPARRHVLRELVAIPLRARRTALAKKAPEKAIRTRSDFPIAAFAIVVPELVEDVDRSLAHAILFAEAGHCGIQALGAAH